MSGVGDGIETVGRKKSGGGEGREEKIMFQRKVVSTVDGGGGGGGGGVGELGRSVIHRKSHRHALVITPLICKYLSQ